MAQVMSNWIFGIIIIIMVLIFILLIVNAVLLHEQYQSMNINNSTPSQRSRIYGLFITNAVAAGVVGLILVIIAILWAREYYYSRTTVEEKVVPKKVVIGSNGVPMEITEGKYIAKVIPRDEVCNLCQIPGALPSSLQVPPQACIVTPAGAPVGAPTLAPVGVPVGTPIGAPVGVPAGASTLAPVGIPTLTPIGAPVGAPTVATVTPAAAPVYLHSVPSGPPLPMVKKV